MILFTEELNELLFERFMTHLVKCAAANRSITAREARRIHLTNLFLSCDHSGVSCYIKFMLTSYILYTGIDIDFQSFVLFSALLHVQAMLFLLIFLFIHV